MTQAPSAAPAATKEAPKKKGLRPMNGKVVKCTQETHDTWSLDIAVGEGELEYVAGQFISIDPKQFPELERWARFMEKLKGKREVVRAYSLAPAPHEPYLTITVKAEEYWDEEDPYPPLLSPLLGSSLVQDREVVVQGYSGHYVLADDIEEHTGQVLHMVAGSGVVPNWALLKDDLENNRFPKLKHTMINTNKTYDDIIYRNGLLQWQRSTKSGSNSSISSRARTTPAFMDLTFKGRPSTESPNTLTMQRRCACMRAVRPSQNMPRKKPQNGHPRNPPFHGRRRIYFRGSRRRQNASKRKLQINPAIALGFLLGWPYRPSISGYQTSSVKRKIFFSFFLIKIGVLGG